MSHISSFFITYKVMGCFLSGDRGRGLATPPCLCHADLHRQDMAKYNENNKKKMKILRISSAKSSPS